ncbi:hypothetical protein E4T44_07601 [Aureobasidium sp. EXF-8845]|nr:hypothetical protein E4T44_07601 [Aureobasidium sp. EXF-8845]KAI4845752.1 hypothetical protein E4T45_07562 [Aureobasidium sp. EXF-8846]
MVEIRKQQYEAHLATVPYFDLYKIYSGRPPISAPQMHQLQVLDYYFNLVEFKLPGEKSVAVQEPVFGGRVDSELKRRESKGRKGMPMQPQPMPGGAFMMPPPGGTYHMAGPGPGRML